MIIEMIKMIKMIEIMEIKGDNKDSEYDDDEYLLKLDRLLKNLKDDKKFLKTFSENIDNKSKEN